jgi:hypothetical protein
METLSVNRLVIEEREDQHRWRALRKGLCRKEVLF